jgi:hypothetical protein
VPSTTSFDIYKSVNHSPAKISLDAALVQSDLAKEEGTLKTVKSDRSLSKSKSKKLKASPAKSEHNLSQTPSLTSQKSNKLRKKSKSESKDCLIS